jgi:hypothetical protein
MIRDTTPGAASVQWKALAALTGEERLRQALDLTDFVLELQAEGRRALDELRRTGGVTAAITKRGSS